VPEGQPVAGFQERDVDEGLAPGPTPARDFWRCCTRAARSGASSPIPVPRELVTQVLHAGIWAPSSCNYQMWDFVAVDDVPTNARLAALSSQMGNAPVNVVVAYGRDFSEDGWANIQSASAAIQNMSLAAHVLGLGTFWITQMGDREQVREAVGLPEDRLVVAVLALGWPKLLPRKGPKRRPLAQVAHFNHYAGRAIPSSTRPRTGRRICSRCTSARACSTGCGTTSRGRGRSRRWSGRSMRSCLKVGPKSAREPRRAGWTCCPCSGIVTERLYASDRASASTSSSARARSASSSRQRVVPHARVFGLPGTELPSPRPRATTSSAASTVSRACRPRRALR
jgi:nitroreductase